MGRCRGDFRRLSGFADCYRGEWKRSAKMKYKLSPRDAGHLSLVDICRLSLFLTNGIGGQGFCIRYSSKERSEGISLIPTRETGQQPARRGLYKIPGYLCCHQETPGSKDTYAFFISSTSAVRRSIWRARSEMALVASFMASEVWLDISLTVLMDWLISWLAADCSSDAVAMART